MESLLFILMLWAVIAYLVYQHADENGYNAPLWGLVVFIFGIFGLIPYGIRVLV